MGQTMNDSGGLLTWMMRMGGEENEKRHREDVGIVVDF